LQILNMGSKIFVPAIAVWMSHGDYKE